MDFSRQEYLSELPCPPPGDLPNPRIKPGSPGLQGDFFTAEPPRKPIWAAVSHPVVFESLGPHRLWPARFLCLWDSPGKSTGVDCLLQRNFPTQGPNAGLLHRRQVLYRLSYREVLFGQLVLSKPDKDKILFPANSQLGTSVELLLLMTKVSSFPGTLKVKYGSTLSCKELWFIKTHILLDMKHWTHDISFISLPATQKEKGKKLIFSVIFISERNWLFSLLIH